MTGRLTASFGLSPDPFKKGSDRDHKGIDFAASLGTPIFAPAKGTVVAATDIYNNKPKYGKVVVIKTAGNVKTLFAHLDSYKVKQGDQIQAGSLIATVGQSGEATGPHLHMETTVDGTRVDPLDVWQLTK
jgi:murein DD-endopeptidase MepM/ murein hydrolase activator NlpD